MKTNHNVNSIVAGIIQYLAEQKALDLLPEIAQQLTQQSWVKVDHNLATVFSRIKLTPDQLKQIQKSLSSYFNRPIKVKAKIDPTIIAGLRIEIAGSVLDATINRKLKQLKTKVIYD